MCSCARGKVFVLVITRQDGSVSPLTAGINGPQVFDRNRGVGVHIGNGGLATDGRHSGTCLSSRRRGDVAVRRHSGEEGSGGNQNLHFGGGEFDEGEDLQKE